MLNCPRCQSPNIVSNKPFEQAHIVRATDAARFIQTLGNHRWSGLAGLGALAMQGINTIFKDCQCRTCGTTFDLDGDPPATA